MLQIQPGHNQFSRDELDRPMLRKMLNALAEPAALTDAAGNILVANQLWVDNAEPYPDTGAVEGANLLRGLISLSQRHAGMKTYIQPINALLNGEMDEAEIAVEGMEGSADFRLELKKVTLASQDYILVRGHDVSDLNQLRALSGTTAEQMLRERDEERRRIARELHDSTAQLLVGLQLNLAHLQQAALLSSADIAEEDIESVLSQCETTLDSLQKDLRDFDFLHCPDTLADRGIASSLEEVISSFAETTGLEIRTDFSVECEPADNVAFTIYRLAQEALTNAHRHARAKKVTVRLKTNRECAYLLVRDDGLGFSMADHDPLNVGVGIAGMKERVAECGGTISIDLRPGGSAIDVILPLGSPDNWQLVEH